MLVLNWVIATGKRELCRLETEHLLSFLLLFQIYILPVPIIAAWHFISATVSLDQISHGSNIFQRPPLSSHWAEAAGQKTWEADDGPPAEPSEVASCRQPKAQFLKIHE